MTLRTDRLHIGQLKSADVPALVALWTDPGVTRYLGGPRDAEAVRLRLEADTLKQGAPPLEVLPVVEIASGVVVGHCGLIPKEVDGVSETESIYVLARPAWGKGYATEAASAVMDYAFGAMGLPRLVALIDPLNRASGRVAEKLGMRLERETLRPCGKLLRVYAKSIQ